MLVLVLCALPSQALAAGQPVRQDPAPFAGVRAPAPAPASQVPQGWVVKTPVGPDPLLKPQVQHDPAASARLNAQARDLAKAGKLDEAAGRLLQALLANRDNAAAWNNLGLVLRRMGQTRDAVRAYMKAITLQPKHAPTYKNLAVALEAQGDRAMAAKSLREYARLAPNAPDAAAVTQRALWLERNPGGGPR